MKPPPREVMLGWHAGGWPRAYWGEDLFGFSPRYRIGDRPAVGQWTRLEVPAYKLGIGTQTVNGMALSVQHGRVWFDRAGKRACELPDAAPALTFRSDETVWFDDAPPPGAQLQGVWTWDAAVRASGTQSHVQPPSVEGAEHWFGGATSRIVTGPRDELFVYAYIDPCNPPREIMIGWHDGNWDHRAYWGEDIFPHGGSSRVRVGDLPEAGRWVKLAVPASAVRLSGSTIDGMAFSVYGGRVWFDRAGVTACAFPPPAAPSLGSGDSVWIDDDPPAGAALSGAWSWDVTQKAAGTRSMANPAWNGPREFWFSGAATPLTPSPNDKLFVHVLIDPCAPPREIMIGWHNGSWPRFYWGEDLFPFSPRTRMGDIPAGGQWVRLEVPASMIGPAGQSITGMAFSVHGGRAWFDLAGIAAGGSGGNMPMTSAGVAPSSGPMFRRHSLYTPELALLAETAMTDVPTPPVAYEYIWFNGQPAAQIETATGAVHWYFNDHLGSPLLTTNATATVDWRVERDPYGRPTQLRTGLTRHQPLGLPGQEYDPGTDLMYNMFRWYRAGWGRYTQSDPISVGSMFAGNVVPQYDSMYSDRDLRRRMYIPQFDQPFGYAVTNPLGAIDVTGLSAATTLGKLCTNIPHPVGKAMGVLILALAAANGIDNALDQPKKCDDCPTKKCLPCDPPLGTLSYRTDSAPHAGMTGLHIHIYEMHQSPPFAGCKCFWHEVGHPYQPPVPPPGAIPIRPAGGGGVG